MKKSLAFMLVLSFLLPFGLNAADKGKITVEEGKGSANYSSITVKGIEGQSEMIIEEPGYHTWKELDLLIAAGEIKAEDIQRKQPVYSISKDFEVLISNKEGSEGETGGYFNAFKKIKDSRYELVVSGNKIADFKGELSQYDLLVFHNFSKAAVYVKIEPEKAQKAEPTFCNILINGKRTELDAYLIDSSNYLKLRDLAMVLRETEKKFEVKWESGKNAVYLASKAEYTTVGGELETSKGGSKDAIISKSEIYKDNVRTEAKAYIITENNYFKLRDICKIMDIYVDYDGINQTVVIDTSRPYTEQSNM